MAMNFSTASDEQSRDMQHSERKNTRLVARRRLLQLVSISALLAAAGCKTRISPPDLGRYDRINPGP